MGDDGRSLVTKDELPACCRRSTTSAPAPEPNLTIWYSPRLPDGFRRFAAQVAIDTSAAAVRERRDHAAYVGRRRRVACCVSPMLVGKQMQFFGRGHLAKCMLYGHQRGRDEVSGEQVGPASPPSRASTSTSRT
jgi:formate C-acetyltransferase